MIRPANGTDLDEVIELYIADVGGGDRPAIESAILRLLYSETSCILVDVEDDGVVGQVFFDIVDEVTLDGRYLFVYGLYVRPEWRMHGVAKAFVEFIKLASAKLNATRITFCQKDFKESRFYERQGARVSRVEYEVIL